MKIIEKLKAIKAILFADEFNKCIKYFENLNELGYRAAMHKTSDHYVITIMW